MNNIYQYVCSIIFFIKYIKIMLCLLNINMSKILDQDHQLYFKFQKIFNMFDIYLKRELVSDFVNNSNNTCLSQCFDDERKILD